MGIRFYCSHCKRKLNVKAFQGGRQGLCPYCGGSIPIPTESTRPSSKELRDRGLEAHPANPGCTPGESPLPTQPLEDPLGEELEEPFAGARPAPQAAAATPVRPSGPGGLTASASPTANRDSIPAAQTPLAAYAPRQPAGGAPPPTPAAVDPLEEAPDAVWYVRPPAGGQFGPAARDVMRGWIDEGRVTPDSLVWRDGWGDWQPASTVFTQLPARQATPQRLAGASRATPTPVPANPQHATGRGRPSPLHAAIIAILVLAVVVLSGVFIWIIQS